MGGLLGLNSALKSKKKRYEKKCRLGGSLGGGRSDSVRVGAKMGTVNFGPGVIRGRPGYRPGDS